MKPFVLLATRDHDKAARDEYESVRLHAGLAPDELVHLRVEAGPLPRAFFRGLIYGQLDARLALLPRPNHARVIDPATLAAE